MNSGGIKRARLIRLVSWSLCFAPLIVAAERSGSPVSVRAGAEVGAFDRAREGIDRTDADRRFPGQQETPAEREQAMAFLHKHAPNRYAEIEKRGGPKEKGMRFMINRWRKIAALQSESPELYNTMVREVEVEDDLLGICLRLKHGGDRQALHEQMKARIADLFDLGVKERTLRIARVETALGEQKKTLSSEVERRDQIISERFELIKTEGVEGAPLGLKRALKAGRRGSSTEPSPADEPSPGAGQEK